jgi:hypothetical protein
MLEDRLGFEMLFDRNNTLVSEMIDMIFATMVTSLEVDFFCICLALAQESNSRMLTHDGSNERR